MSDWPVSHMLEAKEIASAIRDLAAAIREHTARMFPGPDPVEAYRCENCGSPNWKPGGMGDQFRACLDCDEIGELINAPGNSEI